MAAHLVDTNVWLALAIADHVHHDVALRWWDTVSEPGAVVMCRATQQGFLRLMTNAAVFLPYGGAPLTNDEAWAAHEAIAADDRVVVHEAEPPGLQATWKQFASRAVASPKLWMDAYLAAFAVRGGYTLVTSDAAFTQFDQLDLTVL